VTNTYLYGKRCSLAKLGHDKEGVKGRPLIQVGLAVTKDSGIPVCHKVLDGNIHDARLFKDFLTDLRPLKIDQGLVIYDRGIASSDNIAQAKAIGWETLCGLPIRGHLVQIVREMAKRNPLVQLENRVRLRKNIFYGVRIEHRMGETPGWLTICYNQVQQRELRESRYDEIEQALDLLSQGRAIKAGMEKYFTASRGLRKTVLAEAEEFDGYFCLFSTTLLPLDQMVRLYFDKDLIEKAFRTLKGVTSLRPIRHWLYNRVKAHVFICYLAYLLLSLLQYKLQKYKIQIS
jgi:transposase